MSQVEQITYRTRISDIKRMVEHDFGVVITDEVAGDIFEADNLGQLVWTNQHIKAIGHLNFVIDRDGHHETP